MRQVAAFVAESLQDNGIPGGRDESLRMLHPSAATGRPPSSPARAAASARRSPSNSPAAAAGSCAATSTRRLGAAPPPTPSWPPAGRPRPCAATSRRSTTSNCSPRKRSHWFGGAPTLVINNAGVGAGGAPIGEIDLDDWNWVLGINLWGPIHGCQVFTPILREAGQRGGHHQRRVGRSVRRRAWDGRLQRQQGRRAVPVGDAGRRTVGHRHQRHRAVPDVREDEHRRLGPHLAALHASSPTG